MDDCNKNTLCKFSNYKEQSFIERLFRFLGSLPTEPPRSQLSIIEGVYVARYKTGIGELRLQSMCNPQFTLPPEFQSPLIVKNGWIHSRPGTDFALIDIDHSITFSQPVSMKTKNAL